VIAACEEQGADYLIPARENERVSRFLDRSDERVAVTHEYAVDGAVKGRASKGESWRRWWDSRLMSGESVLERSLRAWMSTTKSG
jgi:hypothetical protein